MAVAITTAPSSTSWSYGHFLYKLYEPYETVIQDADLLLSFTQEQANDLLVKFLQRYNELEMEMNRSNIKLRPNKMYIHCVDIDYDFPDNYDFLGECRKFIKSSGVIVFQHLNNFNIIKKYLEMFKRELPTAQHPLTADTLWHLNPFNIDMLHVYVLNLYNFRGETPNERRLLAELLNFPIIGKFIFDTDNKWDMDTRIYIDQDCKDEDAREPAALCKYIRKNGAK